MSTVSTKQLILKTRRLKRPSFSPTKPQQQLERRSQSEELQPPPPIPYSVVSSSVDFEEFTLGDPRESFAAFFDFKDQLLAFLDQQFKVDDITYSPPFLFLRSAQPPPLDERPFSIAGCIAVWLGPENAQPDPYPGLTGGDDEPRNFAEVDEQLSKELVPFQMPDAQLLFKAIQRPFPDAIAVTMIYNVIIVEFEEIDVESWWEKLDSLPMAFKNINFSLHYTNGPLVNTKCKCLKKSQPRPLPNLFTDDTDYVEERVTSGIAVQKEGETRVLTASHRRGQELKENSDKFGNPADFIVTQGKTRVDYLKQTIDNTNITLMKLDEGVKFRNHFLDIDCVPKHLLHGREMAPGDMMVMDSFVTGRQQLQCAGVRAYNAAKRYRSAFLKGKTEDNPPSSDLMIHAQGVFATNVPETLGHPELRAGMCGAVIIRDLTSKKEKVLDKGEICGIMHWADLEQKYGRDSKLFCFADVLDPLIDDGWECSVGFEDEEDATPALKRRRL
ncbi:hypothetical protein FQN50_007230 [Emmonsiellopsis sp. PD_5]|nr:hypothetical protein FQN50_007230 [Emmonsiellopsis sp. PD_5]